MKEYHISENELKQIIKESALKIITETNPLRIEDYFNLGEISKKNLMLFNTDVRIHVQRGYGMQLSFDDNDDLIVEYEVRTLPVEELRVKLKQLGFEDWQVRDTIYANNVRIVILYADIEKNTENIIKEMNAFGWTIAQISEPKTNNGITFRAMAFDPAVQQCLSHEAYAQGQLYHLTPVINARSILKNGIEPRNANDYLDYPPRAHFIKGNAPLYQIAKFGHELFKHNKKAFDGNYTVFRINMDKIPYTIKFYGDPRCEIGYFTKETVPPEGIELFGYVYYEDKNEYQEERIQQLPKNQ